jgi:diadenosine tetraphosphate (Ap4A) HIT family hydrolase
MADHDDSCWFCNPEVRTDPSPGGWVLEDRVWRASHAPAGYGPLGTVILESRRHVLDQAGFDPEEAATYAAVTGLLVDAIRRATGCDRVYQWATMDGFPHFHLWLVPWSHDDELRGPRFLVDRLVTQDGCDAESAAHVAAALRTIVATSDREQTAFR